MAELLNKQLYLCSNLRRSCVVNFSLQKSLVNSCTCFRTSSKSWRHQFCGRVLVWVQVFETEGDSKWNMSNGAAENGVDRQVIVPPTLFIWSYVAPISGRRSRPAGRRPAWRRWWETWRRLLRSASSQVFVPICYYLKYLNNSKTLRSPN